MWRSVANHNIGDSWPTTTVGRKTTKITSCEGANDILAIFGVGAPSFQKMLQSNGGTSIAARVVIMSSSCRHHVLMRCKVLCVYFASIKPKLKSNQKQSGHDGWKCTIRSASIRRPNSSLHFHSNDVCFCCFIGGGEEDPNNTKRGTHMV